MKKNDRFTNKIINNKSAKYPDGRTFQSFDTKIVGEKKDNTKGRRVVVVDSNRKDELAVVALTSKKTKNTTALKEYKSSNGSDVHFRHYVENKDSSSKPIKEGKAYVENSWDLDVGQNGIRQIKNKVFVNSSHAPENKAKMQELKFGKKKPKQ